MVIRIPWLPEGFLDHSGDPLPGHFLRMLLVDLVSLVDGSESAFGGAARDDLGIELGRVPSTEEQDSSQGEALMALSREGAGAGNPFKGEEARWE